MRLSAIRRLALSGGLVAAAFALKYPLIGIPNVEPLTVTFFALGYAYGPAWGAVVGVVGELIYATFNPYGAQIFPVWIAQITGMALAGILGGCFRVFQPMPGGGGEARRPSSGRRRLTLAVFTLAVAGIITTLCYDILTNLALAWAIGPFWPTMIAALPFTFIHMASNALLFPLIFPILRRWLVSPPSTVLGPNDAG